MSVAISLAKYKMFIWLRSEMLFNISSEDEKEDIKMKRKLALFLSLVMLISVSLSLASCKAKKQAGAEVLQDVRVRKALSLAIDRAYLNETVWNNSRIEAYSLVPEGIMDTEPGTDFRKVGGDLMTTDYDAAVTEAKSLLKEAGFPDGKGFPTLEFVYNTNTQHQQVAEAVQSMWKEQLGITVNLSSMEWNVFLDYRKGPDSQIARQGWLADYADASSFFDLFVSDSGTNDGHYNNPEYDERVKDAKFLTDQAERARLYHEAEEILMNDMGMIPLVFYADDVLIQQGYEGYGVTATGNKYFWEVNQPETTVCVGSQPATLDPNLNETVDGMIYVTHMFEGLYRPNNDGTFELGQAAEVKNDGTKYTVTLRDDIFWSDGEPVTAYDFEFSWRRLVDPATASSYGYIGADFFKNGADVLDGTISPEELSVKAIDDKTLEFEIAAEFTYVDELLAFPSLMPLRQDIVEANPEAWSTVPETLITNGRYVMETIANEDKLVMVKNDKYWDPDSTKVETITYKLMSDDNAILAAFKNNELDLIDTFPSDETVSLEATPEFHRFGNLGLYYLQVNHEAGSTADAEE